MHKSIKNLQDINRELAEEIKENSLPNIIAVSKTFPISEIVPLINHGHIHFGENKTQEAISKWTDTKLKYPNIKLHLVGKLQTNKVKYAVRFFDFVHSLDSKKLAMKISEEQKKQNKKIKLFIQVNIGEEVQKSGIDQENLKDLYNYSKELNLDVIGLMCIPPLHGDTEMYFQKMNILNRELNLKELSMGMSADYIDAAKNFSTYIRIGSKIFGSRS